MGYQQSRVQLAQAGVDTFFADRVEQRVAPSSVYAVFTADGISFDRGFGAVAGRTPSIDTGYRIASITKSFTAAAVLILVERGLLSLDDSITDHLRLGPLLGPGDVEQEPPTVRQLLSMAGGLPTDDAWADRQESMSTAEFDRFVGSGLRFISQPGQRYEYSNVGFALLGRLITQLSGQDYIDFVTGELITPLGLTGIGYDRSVAAADGIAEGFRDLDGNWQSLPFTEPGTFSAIGGVVATARAVAGWARWLNGADHDQLLSAQSRQLMQTGHTRIADRQAYGFGLVVDDHPRHGRIVSHSGGYPGYGAHLRWHADSGIGIVAFENATYSRPKQPATGALELILDETIRPELEPRLWPETMSARATVERLLRGWEDKLAADLFADNVDLDESLERRRTTIAELVDRIDLDPHAEPLPLVEASPISESPAQLSWTVPGRRGSLRCRVELTPQVPARVQTLTVRLG